MSIAPAHDQCASPLVRNRTKDALSAPQNAAGEAKHAHAVRGAPIESWDRLWRSSVSEGRDNALLDRECKSPRWGLIHARLIRTFGDLRGLKTLELGSGRGDLSALLAGHGANVTLLDSSAAALRAARSRFTRLGYPVETHVGDLFALPQVFCGRFDCVLSSGVLEHFVGADRRTAVARHRDALRDGGVCVISVPNAACLPYRLWKLCLELRGWWPYGLEAPFSRAELLECAEWAGLEQVSVHGVGFWQSAGDHVMRGLLGKPVDWVSRRSRLDATMGMSLVLMGRRFIERGAGDLSTVTVRHFAKRGRGPEFQMECDWLLRRMPASPVQVLEVGCGNGGFVHQLNGKEAIGVDASVPGLRMAKTRTPAARFIASDALRIPFPDRTFDVLVLQHVIEHIPDVPAALTEWRRVLRPGGTLLLVTPNARFEDPSVFADETHVQIFDRSTLAKLLSRTGFKLFDHRTLGLPFGRVWSHGPGGWQLRRLVIRHAEALSRMPGWKDKGQSLVCSARKPD